MNTDALRQDDNPNAKPDPDRHAVDRWRRKQAKKRAKAAFWATRRVQMGKPDAEKIADARKRRARMREARTKVANQKAHERMLRRVPAFRQPYTTQAVPA